MRMPRRGMRPTRLAVVLLMAMLPTIAIVAPSQEAAAVPLTVDAVIAAAIASSSAVRSLEIRLADQLEDLGISGYLDGIRLSISGSFGGTPDTDLTYSSSARLSANVEIIPQLSVNGSVIANLLDDGIGPAPDSVTANVGLVLSPLADSTGRDRDLIAVAQTELDLAVAVERASHTAVTQLLDAVATLGALSIKREQVTVAEQSLANSQALYERERVSDEQLDGAERSLRSTRQNLLRSELSAERAIAALAQTIGVPVDPERLPAVASLELNRITEEATEFLESTNAYELAENEAGAQSALLAVEIAELDLKSARMFSPQLSVSASTTIPDLNYSVSADISISPSDFDFDARDQAEDDLVDAQRAYEYGVRLAEFDVRSAIMDVQFAIEDLQSAEFDLAQAEEDLAQTQFFLDRGEITELQLRQAELDLATAENDLVAAQITVTKRWYAIEFRQY